MLVRERLAATQFGAGQQAWKLSTKHRTFVAGFSPASSACGTATATDTFCPPSTGRAVKRHSWNAAAVPDAVACTVFGPSACTPVSLGGTAPAGGGGLRCTAWGGGGLRLMVLAGGGGLRLVVWAGGGGLRLVVWAGGGGLGCATWLGGGGLVWRSGGGGEAAAGAGRSPIRHKETAAPARASSRVPSCSARMEAGLVAPATYR